MTEKSRLAEILNLKEDEEYTVKGDDYYIYRIHNGKRQCKEEYTSDDWMSDDWMPIHNEDSLSIIINNPSLIQKKPRFNEEEMTFLRLLRKYGKVTRISRSGCATYIEAKGGDRFAHNIGELLKPEETLNLDEMFESIMDED